MCRWIAYHGESIPLDSYVIKPVHSLVKQSVNSLESTATFNGDGFGLGWYGEPAEPGLYKEVFPAWSDENLLHLGKHLRSHLFFAHVRAATGTAVSRQNCHPFACGKWLFMHNGVIGNWKTLRRDVERLIPDELWSYRGGTTDSEALFLAMMSSIEGPEDPIEAAERMVAEVTRLADGAPFRFTAALANGRDLYAFRYSANDASNTLYYRAHGHAVVVASEPLDQDRGSWIGVPENSALVSRWGLPVQIVPFAQGSGEVGAVANSG